MKIPRRTVTAALALAVIACALVLTMRSFAQAGPYDIDLPNYQKLKAPYDEDVDGWEKNVLKKHSKKYCVTHRKKNGKESKRCPTSVTDASQALPIPVAGSPAAAPGGAGTSGVNVTQKISCGTQADQDAVEATFDTGG